MKDDDMNAFDGAEVYGVYEPGEEVECYSTTGEAITSWVKFWMEEDRCSVDEAIDELSTRTIGAFNCGAEEDELGRVGVRRYTADEVRTVLQSQAPELFA